MNLRNYQVECLNQLKVFHKNLVHLSTGAGKSVIFKEFIRERLKNNQKVLFLVYGNSILEQAVKKHFSSISNNVSYNDFKGEIMCYSNMCNTWSNSEILHFHLFLISSLFFLWKWLLMYISIINKVLKIDKTI